MVAIFSLLCREKTKKMDRKQPGFKCGRSDPDVVRKLKPRANGPSLSYRQAQKRELIIMRAWLIQNAYFMPSDDIEYDITVVASVFLQFFEWLGALGRKPRSFKRALRVLKLHLGLASAGRGLSLEHVTAIWGIPHQTIRDGMGTDLVVMVYTSPFLPAEMLQWIGTARPVYEPMVSKRDSGLLEVCVDVAAAEAYIKVQQMFPKSQLASRVAGICERL